MNHLFETECSCSIFQSKNINLKILSIHSILCTIENLFMKYGNFEFFNDFYQCTRQIFFHIKVEMFHVSQYKNSEFIMECNLETLFFVLQNYFDLNKIVGISFEMLSSEKYLHLKLEKISKNVDYELFFP